MYIIIFILTLLVGYGLYELTTLKSRVESLDSKLKTAEDGNGSNSNIQRSSNLAPDSKNISEDCDECSGNKSQNRNVTQSEKIADDKRSNDLDETLDNGVRNDEVSSQSKEKIEGVSKEKLVNPQETFLYAKQFDNGELRICDEIDAFYKLQIVSDDEAKFEFCGDLSRAMNNFNAVFDDVIDYSRSSSTATKCNMVEKGEAKRISDSKWKVTKKAKIEFLL
jgi:hypothetical protein